MRYTYIYNNSANPSGKLDTLDTVFANFVSVSSDPYAVASSDAIILADASVGAIGVNLPSAALNQSRILTIKKVDSSGNLVSINCNGAEKIDGESTIDINTQWAAVTIFCDGDNWYII